MKSILQVEQRSLTNQTFRRRLQATWDAPQILC